jgi:hypothetical protein
MDVTFEDGQVVIRMNPGEAKLFARAMVESLGMPESVLEDLFRELEEAMSE